MLAICHLALIVSSRAVPKWVATWICQHCFVCYAYKFSFREYIRLPALCPLVHTCTSTF